MKFMNINTKIRCSKYAMKKFINEQRNKDDCLNRIITKLECLDTTTATKIQLVDEKNNETITFLCSECNEDVYELAKYCENCGRRFIDEVIEKTETPDRKEFNFKNEI